jgi:hypothetical protein
MQASRLSAIVKQLGYTGSPLTPAEFSKLRETIQSLRTENTPKRLNLPPVTFCCAQCQTNVTKSAADYVKLLTRSVSGNLYCSKTCMGLATRTDGRKCVDCGTRVDWHGVQRCKVCRPKFLKQRSTEFAQARATVCQVCGKTFASHWKAGAAQTCSRECAAVAHSQRMAGAGNSRYLGAAAKRVSRQMPHNKAAFRYAKLATLDRDAHACKICGETKTLHVHHIDENPLHNSYCNLLTLCVQCHRQVHRHMDANTKAILCDWLK